MVKKMFGRHCKKKNGAERHTSCSITPLSKKHNCGPARVCKINGDRKDCARLAALGLYPGNEIELVCPTNGDQCIIKVHGGTISIDRTITENILITE